MIATSFLVEDGIKLFSFGMLEQKQPLIRFMGFIWEGRLLI